MKLNNEEMIMYKGGAVSSMISAALVTAVLKMMKFCYEVGQNLGGLLKNKYGKGC